MPPPTRPEDTFPTATEWGQAVHDFVFTPKGVRVAGGAASSVDAAFEQLQLNTAVDDPGGWLASDSLTVPAGAGRLYEWFMRIRTDEGVVGEDTRWQIRVNTVTVVSGRIANDGSTAVTESVAGLLDLTAGDVINVWAAKTGGASPDVLVVSLDFVERAYELGA